MGVDTRYEPVLRDHPSRLAPHYNRATCRVEEPRMPWIPPVIRSRVLAAAVLLLPLFPLAVHAQIPGERWRVTASGEMPGMKMPSRTTEACLPRDKPEEAFREPPADGADCRLLDLAVRGNRTTGRIECRGDGESMRGTFEVISEPNRMRSNFDLTTRDGPIVMRNDATRLGVPCTIATAVVKAPPPLPVVAAQPDTCAAQLAKLRENPDEFDNIHSSFFGVIASCKSPAQRQGFCELVRAPEGFASLRRLDARAQGEGADAVALRSIRGQPMAEVFAGCGFGASDAAVLAMRTQTAEASRKLFAGGGVGRGAATLLVLEGADADYQMLRDSARQQCRGRMSTSMANQDLYRFCSTYGEALVRDDRNAVREIAGLPPTGQGASSEVARSDGASGANSAAGGSSGAAGSSGTRATGAAPAAGQAGSSASSASAPAQGGGRAPAADGSPVNAVGDLLRRGRGMLDGILGR
jgi:hypothetical protein